MRRWLLIVFVLASVGTGGLLLWRAPTGVAPYVPLGPGDTYLALGDSLAAGFTVGDPEEAYVARIAGGLRQIRPGISLTNLSIPGETSRSLRAGQLSRARDFIASEQAAGRRVSPITLDIGGNDARAVERGDQQEREAMLQAVETNLGFILDRLLAVTRDQAGARTADVVVMNYYNPFPGDVTAQDSAAYWSVQLNLAIRRAAEGHGVPVADVATAFGGGLVYRYTYITTGDIHANADGHRVIAEQFWQALDYPGVLATQR